MSYTDKIIERNDEPRALAWLLEHDYVYLMNCKLEGGDEWNTVVFVLMSDVFWLSCADGESITNTDYEDGSEIIDLYKRCKENERWGYVHWGSVKRNMKPHPYVVKQMIDEGVWTDEMENLPPNPAENQQEL